MASRAQGQGEAAVWWLRRDLRVAGNAALTAAVEAARGRVVALFVLDDHLRGPSGANRLAFLYRALRDLDSRIGHRLVVRTGDPAQVVAQVAAEARAPQVFCAEDFGPYGGHRDGQVEAALRHARATLHRIGSPYAVAPGTVVKSDGTPYAVFTPFYRSWRQHLDPEPLPLPPTVHWVGRPGSGVPPDPPITAALPDATEAAAQQRLRQFTDGEIDGYERRRDRPDLAGTSRLSPYLKFGLLHPDQVLLALGHGEGAGAERFRAELAWREFYADVLWRDPESARRAWAPTMRPLRADGGRLADSRFRAWAEGRTGYPLVDAGMRQLEQEGWMHNRVRMVTASFLVKDLHLPWQRGARHFLDRLVDGDLASNNHGWQWVAGTGTDASPYFRIFNPVTQSKQWDPDGSYIGRYLPELASVRSPKVHEPWRLPGGPPAGYPAPIVDHRVERREALARYREARQTSAKGAAGAR